MRNPSLIERLPPLDLTLAELAERRALRTGAVVVLSNTWPASVESASYLDGVVIGFWGAVLPCPLGVADYPAGELVSFEPAHIVEICEPWLWERRVDAARAAKWRPRPRLAELGAQLASIRTRGEFRRAYSMPGRLGQTRDPLD